MARGEAKAETRASSKAKGKARSEGKAVRSKARTGRGAAKDARRGGSRAATSRQVRDRVTSGGRDADPEVPVHVDDPIPAPSDPEPDPETPVPVRVDDPVPATPTPTPAPEDETPPDAPGKVDDPDPSDRADQEPSPPADPIAAPPTRPIDTSSDTPVQARIDELLRRKRLRFPDGGGDARQTDLAPANAQPVPQPGVAEVQPQAKTAAQPQIQSPNPGSPVVDRSTRPAGADTAPRIALSSGGGRSTYRQHEISVLGLTPRARQLIGALGFRIISERRSPLLGNRVVAKLRTPANQTAETSIAQMRRLMPELTFEFAHLYRPSGNSVPVRYPAEMVGAPAPGACSIDARIGLIDSGVGDHATLARADIVRRNFVGSGAATNVAHGTAIASILVGELPGSGPLAPGAKVFSANVFAQDASGLRADAHAIIEALDWLAAQRVPVVNLSLMGPPDALLSEAVAAATRRGQVLVAAAGNDGPGAAPAYPGAYPEVIAVAALDSRGRPYSRNNRGSYVYVSAPGVDVWGADARGGQAFWTGTSFAAPFVTAMLARDIAVGRAHDVNDSRIRIATSARDLGAPGRDPIYGHGLLQVGGCTGTAGAVLSTRN